MKTMQPNDYAHSSSSIPLKSKSEGSRNSTVKMMKIGENHDNCSSSNLYRKPSMVIMILLMVLFAIIVYPSPEVALCLPKNIINTSLSSSSSLATTEQEKNSDVFSAQNSRNSPDTFKDDTQDHPEQHHRSKREVFVFPTLRSHLASSYDYDSMYVPKHRVPRMHPEQILDNKLNQTGHCWSQRCFRRVTEFETFIQRYNSDLGKTNELECLLRNMFFKCLTEKTKEKKCNMVKYKEYKKKIADFVWQTRLCIKENNYN